MWWSSQNLKRPVRATDGRLWHFRVWHDHVAGVYTQRIYFWDDSRTETGRVEFAGDQVLHISKIKQRMRKIVTDPGYRERHLRELEFPVERHGS